MLFTQGEDLYQTVLKAPIGICILNADTLVAEMVNDKFLEVAGKPYENLFGKFYWDTFAEVRSLYEPLLAKVVQTGEAYYADEAEMRLIRHGREEMIFVTFVYAPVKDDAGNVNKIAVWVLENTKQVNERQGMETARVAFQRERDRLKRFFMQAPAGICILDGPELVYELINPGYEQLLPGRKLLGRPIFEALPELIDTPLEEVLQNVYRTGTSYVMNELLVPLATYEGGPTTERYFTFSYEARRDENDEVDGILVFAFEVTGMIKVQHELREARERADQQKRVYETITSGTPDLMYVFDLNYRFTYANQALLAMWGKTWENAIGKGLLENGYEPWHAEMHEREIDHVKGTKATIRGEVSFPHAELGTRVYDYILIPVLDADGNVEAVAGTTRDVTEHKRSEELLARTFEELQATNEEMATINEELSASNEELTATNEELAFVNHELLAARQKIEEGEVALRLAINAANFGTWFIHSVKREFIVDARLKELFGYYPDEELTIEGALAQITDEYRAYVSDKMEQAIYNNGDYDVTYPVIGLHDNKLRWLRAIGNLKADQSGAFSAFTGVVMDITEQKMDELRKNDFIGMVSHELKTPLTSMKAYVQVLLMKQKQGGENLTTDILQKANSQVTKMTKMINSFLNVSRLEAGKIHIERQIFDLALLMKEAEEEAVATIFSHTLVFEPVESAFINADWDKIGQVIHNLISNAVKYSRAESVIHVDCINTNGVVKVSVKDEGMGINPNDLSKIFDRYYRVEGSQMFSISGFGIGLYLCKEIIDRHDGEISADSEFGKGSTFTFRLPLHEK